MTEALARRVMCGRERRSCDAYSGSRPSSSFLRGAVPTLVSTELPLIDGSWIEFCLQFARADRAQASAALSHLWLQGNKKVCVCTYHQMWITKCFPHNDVCFLLPVRCCILDVLISGSRNLFFGISMSYCAWGTAGFQPSREIARGYQKTTQKSSFVLFCLHFCNNIDSPRFHCR